MQTMDTLKFTFNTYREYTEHGQIICVEVSDGRLWFHDQSRNIAGSLPYNEIDPEWPFPTSREVQERDIKSYLMIGYDSGAYRPESLPQIGMARAQ